MKVVEVFPYNAVWPLQFKEQETILNDCLGDKVIDIHHIGSTSIPGLSAKDSIDILLIVQNLSDSLKLEIVGYTYKGEINIPLRYYFSKNDDKAKVNLHVCEKDHGFINLNLYFRDFLRVKDELRDEYQKLKYSLLNGGDPHTRLIGFLSNYGRGKDTFVKKVLSESGFDSYIMNFSLHDKEISEAKKYIKRYCDDHNISFDSFSFDFDNQSVKHVSLYKGASIVGHAVCELFADSSALVKMLVTKDGIHDEKFNGLINEWLIRSNYFVMSK